jgi:hypothetical protein
LDGYARLAVNTPFKTGQRPEPDCANWRINENLPVPNHSVHKIEPRGGDGSGGCGLSMAFAFHWQEYFGQDYFPPSWRSDAKFFEVAREELSKPWLASHQFSVRP